MPQLKVNNTMYDILSKGDNNTVIALSKDTAAKLFKLGNVQAKHEYNLLSLANKINNLLVTGKSLEYSEDYNYELLSMERLRVEQYRSFSISERNNMLTEFGMKLSELHKSGFAHGDIKRPDTFINGTLWDNICPTINGIKLIDVGCASLSDDSLFERKVKQDMTNFMEFATVFLE